jgi:hypothetical protein
MPTSAKQRNGSCGWLTASAAVVIFRVTGKYKGPRDLAYRDHRWVLSTSSTAEFGGE